MDATKLETNELKDRAEELFRARRHQRSLALYSELIDRDPGDARLRVRSGELAIRLSRPQDAARAYLRAAELFAAQGYGARAAAALKIARRLAPGDPSIQLRLPAAIPPRPPQDPQSHVGAIELPYTPAQQEPAAAPRGPRKNVVTDELCPEGDFESLYH